MDHRNLPGDSACFIRVRKYRGPVKVPVVYGIRIRRPEVLLPRESHSEKEFEKEDKLAISYLPP